MWLGSNNSMLIKIKKSRADQARTPHLQKGSSKINQTQGTFAINANFAKDTK